MQQHLAGLKIGHATNDTYHTGCTVFLCPENTVGGVDVRGPAPGTRETALLHPDKPLHYVNAIMLTGGSAFGLATADGAMRFLAEKGIGHHTPIRSVPIVPAAVVYDLGINGGNHPPTADLGYKACLQAKADDIRQGNVGAGAGVTVGTWAGWQKMMKGGFGLASINLKGLIVGAGAVVNPVGDVVNTDGSVLAGARHKSGTWMATENPYRLSSASPPAPLTNTTLVVVYTNAIFSPAEANRLAQRAHDGLAIAIRPVHTTHDGDTSFALATGQLEAEFDTVANVAVEMVAEAIRNAVRFATSVGEIPGLGDEQ